MPEHNLIQNSKYNTEISQITIEEYKEKWQYIKHVELMQEREITLYYISVGGIIAYISSNSYNHQIDKWIILLIPAVYSIIMNIKLLLQKRNYDVYLKRIRQIDNSPSLERPINYRVLSIFKFTYYSVVFIGASISGLSYFYFSGSLPKSIAVSTIYAILMASMSFLRVIGK